ncbi:unnamed protein product [Prunus armeniaca]
MAENFTTIILISSSKIMASSINAHKDKKKAGFPFLPGQKLLIRAGLDMPVLDWTVPNFNC